MNREQIRQSLIDSVVKLDPRYLIKNPVLFVVEITTVMVILMTINPAFFDGQESRIYYGIIAGILVFTLLFATFAESLAQAQGEAHTESLRAMKEDLIAYRLREVVPLEEVDERQLEEIPADELNKGDIIFVRKGQKIPRDGTIIEGSASVDESAITGESEPVIRRSGTDHSSVTGGTELLSDEIKVEVTVGAGESFLDRMIGLVESATREKTPSEISLTLLLASFTFIYMLVISTMFAFGQYVDMTVDVANQIALLIGLMPTTVGALLSAIRIAGMTRVTRHNVIAKSGKAVEAAGDLDVLVLDKTGTITTGERVATAFIPLGEHTEEEVVQASLQASYYDETTEGRSVIFLARQLGYEVSENGISKENFVEFSAKTGMSGIDLKDGQQIRKGSVEAVREIATQIPDGLDTTANQIADNGGTPLAVLVDNEIIGLIKLQDELKQGIQQRIKELQKMGIRTIMCTGDNSRTARYIAEQAGITEFYAEFKPEEKIDLVRRIRAEGNLVGMTGDGTNDAPALAQADVGLAMNAGTMAAKEAGNMVDLDSDPTKLIEVVGIGKQLLMTRGSLTTFSIANDVSRYFALVPAIFAAGAPILGQINLLNLHSAQSTIIASLIYNALIIPFLIPLAMRGVEYKPVSAGELLSRNLVIYGGAGFIAPFISIKLIDTILVMLGFF